MSAAGRLKTREGTRWTLRGLNTAGEGLYAPEAVRCCPQMLLVTAGELAEHGVRTLVGQEDMAELDVAAEVAVLKGLLAPSKAEARVAELEAAPRTVYRAEYDVIPFGLYTTSEAARAHCEAHLRREQPTAALNWIVDDEDGVAELVTTVDGSSDATGYVVIALEVASAYDEEADS